MTDWTDGLSPEGRASWEEFVAHTRRETAEAMAGSAMVLSFVPGEFDVKFAVELGMAIMLEKPILAIVMPGQRVPPKMRLVADMIVEVDIDTEEGRAVLTEAIKEFTDG